MHYKLLCPLSDLTLLIDTDRQTHLEDTMNKMYLVLTLLECVFKWVPLSLASWTWNTFIDLQHAWEYQYNRQIVWSTQSGKYTVARTRCKVCPRKRLYCGKIPDTRRLKVIAPAALFYKEPSSFWHRQLQQWQWQLPHCCGFHLIGYEYKSNQLPLLSSFFHFMLKQGPGTACKA